MFSLVALICLLAGLAVGLFDAHLGMSALEYFVAGIGFGVLGGRFPYALPLDRA